LETLINLILNLGKNCVPSDFKSRELFQFSANNGLHQLNLIPTRYNIILDILFINNPLLVSELQTNAPFCTSDHASLRFVLFSEFIVSYSSSNVALTKVLWPKTNWHDFAIYLYSINWQLLLSTCTNSNDSWNHFSDVINCGIRLFVPIVLVRARALAIKCHSKEISRLHIKRRKFWKQMQTKQNPLRKSKYKLITSELWSILQARKCPYGL